MFIVGRARERARRPGVSRSQTSSWRRKLFRQGRVKEYSEKQNEREGYGVVSEEGSERRFLALYLSMSMGFADAWV